MIPSQFFTIESMPLTPNGKVDVKALQVQQGPSLETSDYCPPQSPTEKLIAQIWSDILDVERIGLNDTFFDLGGHSLLIVQSVAQIKQQLGIQIPFREFFGQTLAQFAASCENKIHACQSLSELSGSFREQNLEFL
jgi:acyl carrier protein